jgi:peptidyl-prolyl cis-trans isomerase SurA
MRLLLLLMLPAYGAELIDRVAVSVDLAVITESEITEHLRVQSLLEGTPLRLDGESKRDAADRLIQQALIRREIETTQYAQPESAQAEPMLAEFKLKRFDNDAVRYQAALRTARITEPELLASFLWQLTVLRFIEFRFRPGIQISSEDIREYYERQFLADWRARSNDPPPSLADATAAVEEILIQQRIDNQLDRWISLTRTQVSIRYREEVFE